jgi:hypothetical protein
MNSRHGSGTLPWLHHVGPTMAAVWPKPSPRPLEDLRRLSAPIGVSPLRVNLWWRIDSSPIGLGCIYALRESWSVLHLALHDTFLERQANLVSIKSVSLRFSYFAALPCWRHISRVRPPYNTNSVSQLCGTKLPTLLLIAFFGNKDKIPKWSRKIIYLISDLSTQ